MRAPGQVDLRGIDLRLIHRDRGNQLARLGLGHFQLLLRGVLPGRERRIAYHVGLGRDKLRFVLRFRAIAASSAAL